MKSLICTKDNFSSKSRSWSNKNQILEYSVSRALMKVYLSFLLVLVCCLTKSFAQDKFEKESRIKKAQVPTTALNFIEAADFSQKIKWYKEESLVRYKFNEKNKL